MASLRRALAAAVHLLGRAPLGLRAACALPALKLRPNQAWPTYLMGTASCGPLRRIWPTEGGSSACSRRAGRGGCLVRGRRRVPSHCRSPRLRPACEGEGGVSSELATRQGGAQPRALSVPTSDSSCCSSSSSSITCSQRTVSRGAARSCGPGFLRVRHFAKGRADRAVRLGMTSYDVSATCLGPVSDTSRRAVCACAGRARSCGASAVPSRGKAASSSARSFSTPS